MLGVHPSQIDPCLPSQDTAQIQVQAEKKQGEDSRKGVGGKPRSLQALLFRTEKERRLE